MRIRNERVLAECLGVLGLSERELARRAGVSHSTVNHLSSGRRRTCSAATASAIEGALGCAPGRIFEVVVPRG